MPLTNYAFADLITFTRSTTATFVGSNGLIQSAAIDAPRFDFDSVTLAPKGFLIEGQKTNLALYSQDASNAAWNKTRASITADATTAPDGTLTGDKLVEDTSTNTHRTSVSAISMTSGTSYTWTIFLKAGERTFAAISLHTGSAGNAFTTQPLFYVNLLTGEITDATATVTASSAVLFSGGWWRVSISATATTTTSNSPTVFLATASGVSNYTGDGTSGLFLWGGQVEAAAFPTSYIPTEASTVTRATDQAVMTGTNFSNWFNASEGTFVASATTISTAASRGVYAASDGTNSNRIYLSTTTTTSNLIITAGSTQADIVPATTISDNTVFKDAFAYRENDVNAATNGVLGTADTSATLPVVDQLRLGARGDGNIRLEGHLRNITYYPTRLTDAQLQALTA